MPVVVGRRGEQAWSLYFGPDCVFHFNSAGELRRAFMAGRIIKAEAGHLVSLTKQRTDSAVNLLRHEFSPQEQSEFLNLLVENVQLLLSSLEEGTAEVSREIPEGEGVLQVLHEWLATLVLPPAVAAKPNVC